MRADFTYDGAAAAFGLTKLKGDAHDEESIRQEPARVVKNLVDGERPLKRRSTPSGCRS